MKRHAEPSGTAEAGFLLVEAVIAAVLVAICAGAALAAVAAVTHARAHARPAAALTLSAQNILTDLRSATAYDGAQLASLAGRSTAFDADEPGPDGAPRRVHIVVGVTRDATTQAYVAEVTATATGGASVTIHGTLVQEAPAPGSVVSASTPAPPDPLRPADTDEIAL